jgi:hypothetical protein
MLTTTHEEAADSTQSDAGMGTARRAMYVTLIRPRQLSSQTPSTETPSAERIRNQVRTFLAAAATQRRGIRELLVQELQQAASQDELASVVAHECIVSAKAGRLDDAIDLLSEASVSPIGLARKLSQGRSFFSLPDDLQFLLVSVAGREHPVPRNPLVMTALAKLSGAACEAAVVTIAKSGDPRRTDMLKWVASHSPSNTIKSLAEEYLADSDE